MCESFTSETVTEIIKALSNFQGEAPTIEKTKSVSMNTRSGYKIKYNYADIADVMASIKVLLKNNGLFVTHSHQMTKFVTTIYHTSGEWIRSSIPFEQSGDEKAMGGKTTYYRRYALSSLLGLVTDDDVDCDGQGGEIVQPTESKPLEKVKSVKDLDRGKMKEFYKENENKPYFKEFIEHVVKKSKFSKEEIIKQGAEKKESFLKSMKAYAVAEEKKRASTLVGK